VTCLSLHRSPTRDEGAGLTPPALDLPGRGRRLLDRLQAEGPVTQFVRFAAVGGSSSLVYALLFVSLLHWGTQPANLVGAVVSTVLANEMHRRLTFHAGDRVPWLAAQLEGGGLTLAGMAATSLALAGLSAWTDVTGATVQLLVIGAVTGLVGLVRFAALRWLFKPGGVHGSAEDALVPEPAASTAA
jgi:putative flippase GtrA